MNVHISQRNLDECKIEKFPEEFLEMMKQQGVDDVTLDKMRRMRGIVMTNFLTDTSKPAVIQQNCTFEYDYLQ